MAQVDTDEAVKRVADVITLAIADAERGDQAALQFLADVLPDWQKRRPGALQTAPTVKDTTAMSADLDTPLDELDGLSRREFASKWNVDPRYVATEPPTPEQDALRRIADALNVNPAYVDPALLVESDVNHG